MAHECINCGGDCFCSGDINDCLVSITPSNCKSSCGCEDTNQEYYLDDDENEGLDINCPKCHREYDSIDFEYQICSRCGYESIENTE